MDATARPGRVPGEDLEDQVAREEQEAVEVDAILEELGEFVPDEGTDLPSTPAAAEEAAVHVYREPVGEAELEEALEEVELQARTQLARAAGTPVRADHEPDLAEVLATHEDFRPR